MLHATGLTRADLDKAQVGISAVWFEGNSGNMHLNDLAASVKRGVVEAGLLGMRFNTIGVSDGISMGTDGMSYSLQSRDLIADLKPSGKYVMEDLHDVGGTPAALRHLLSKGVLHGDCLTVTGKTLAENLADLPDLSTGQDVIQPWKSPIKATGHITIMRGNLESAPKTPFWRPSPTRGNGSETRKPLSVGKGSSHNRRWKNTTSGWSAGRNERSQRPGRGFGA